MVDSNNFNAFYPVDISTETFGDVCRCLWAFVECNRPEGNNIIQNKNSIGYSNSEQYEQNGNIN